MGRRRASTITLNGGAANAFMAGAAASHCSSETEARSLVEGRSGPYCDALVAALRERGFLKGWPTNTDADGREVERG